MRILWISYLVIPSLRRLSDNSIELSAFIAAIVTVLIGVKLPLVNTKTLSPFTNCDLSISVLWSNVEDVAFTATFEGISNLIRLAVL